MSNEISVSVVIPARNAEKTLERAILSVLSQSWTPSEIIVVDDASTDATGRIAQGFEDRGVTTLRLGSQKGAAGARNAGIQAAAGTWIAFLDADDEWLSHKLAKQVKIIRQCPDASFVFCASHEFSPAGRFQGDTYRGRPVTDGPEAWKALLACNFVATPTVVARRDLLLQSGGFDKTLKVAEDQDMWIRLALAGVPVYLAESLVRVHVRAASLSSWKLADQFTYTLPMIERHLAALRSRLSEPEVSAILGERLNRIGSVAVAQGDVVPGIAMMLRSALLGFRPLHNLTLILRLPVRMFGKRFMQVLIRRAAKVKGEACAQ